MHRCTDEPLADKELTKDDEYATHRTELSHSAA
jgi:hypothetical protein